MTLQWPRACPGLTTHTLAGLCAQWLPSTACITEALQNVTKLEEASQTTSCTAVPQPPVQAPPDLLTTHTLARLCAQWLPSRACITEEQLQNVTKPEEASQTTCTAVPQPPVQAPPDLLTAAQAEFDLAVAQGMPRAGHPHTGGALCAVVAEHSLHH